MTELEMKDCRVPTLTSMDELVKYISHLENMEHDYGTACYAISMAAVATFNYMASKLDITGYQASCAGLDIIKRIRRLESGFTIMDYDKCFYPQYLNSQEYFPSAQYIIDNNKEWFAKKAKEKLENITGASENVIQHWKYLVGLMKDVE